MSINKYRAWHKFNKRWIDLESDSYGLDHEGNLRIFYTSCGELMDEVEDYAVVTFYTGLKDKNGVEIYEKDTVYFNDFASDRTGGHVGDNILYGTIEFSCGGWIIKTEKLHYDLYEALVNDDELEVVGHIYDGKSYE